MTTPPSNKPLKSSGSSMATSPSHLANLVFYYVWVGYFPAKTHLTLWKLLIDVVICADKLENALDPAV